MHDEDLQRMKYSDFDNIHFIPQSAFVDDRRILDLIPSKLINVVSQKHTYNITLHQNDNLSGT